ncbi:hypothetical protein A4A49_61542 [Nicotiana attenuata]|uniref:DUF1985 domain-containing protein n=1 Tax=Nicotiana attenuata TaxID=49451 RepID=A0A1J6JH72_NICAT|nr:hypothetical protein A4A49_61542 [Nicotiana attenuata]
MAEVVSLERARSQRDRARNTSRSASNTSGSASIRITRSQSSKECEISDSKSIKEPVVDVSQNNIKPTKKRNDSESNTHTRRNSKSFLKLCSEVRQNKNGSIAKYFKDYPTVSKEHLVDCFLTKIFDSDEDAIKIAVLFVVYSFLFSIKNTKHIDKKYLDLVDKGNYNSYPWGIDIYDETVRTISGILEKQRQYYWLSGFPYAVQVWFYECFGNLDSYVACRRENISPPILWSVTRQLKFEELNDKLYGLPSEKLNLRNMSLENKIEDNVDQIHVTSDDDFVDRPPETLKKQCKMMINENAKRKGTPSNVLEKKGKDVNNLKKQRKDVNETSKMKSIGANDLEKQMMDNVSNSINVTAANKKSGKVHHHNGDVKKDVEGDSERKQDAVNEIKQASGFVDVGNPDDEKWLEMCDFETHKLTAELCKQTRNEDIPASDVDKKSSSMMIPDHEIEMTDTQIDCQIHKITSEFVNESVGVLPIKTTISKGSTHEDATTSSLPIIQVLKVSKLMRFWTTLLEKGDNPFKISITEEIPLSIRDEFSKFVETNLILTKR